jgi:hypothetical protein
MQLKPRTKVVGNADVERAVLLARKDVNEIGAGNFHLVE